ncbi:MAG: WD40 repeat domain-containing protein [Limisphaerales bacterium]
MHDSASVERAVFSPDGRWLATVGGDTSIRLWQTSDWRKVRTLRGHTDPVTAVDFSPDSHALATGARNGEVKLWSLDEPANASERIAFPAAQVVKLACDNAGFGLIHLARGTNGLPRLTAEVWTISPPHRAFTVDLPEGQPSSGVVLRGGRGLVLGGFDGGIRLFGAEGRIQWVVNDAHAGEVYLMDVSSDGSTLVTKGMRGGGIPEGRVRFWRLPQLEPITEWHHFANVHAIKLSDDGRLLAGFTGDGDVGVWEVPSMKGAPMWRGLATLQEPRDCAFSPDKRWLAAVTDDGDAYLWNLSTHRRTVFPRSMATYHSLSFSPDGTRLAAGSDGESKLFDTATGQTVLSFRLPGLKLGFTQDGERLLAVHRLGASVFHAPPFQKLQFDWMRTPPTQDPPPFRGPDPGYERPDRPRAVDP